MTNICKRAALVMFAVLTSGPISQAGDMGQHNTIPADIRSWVERLTDQAGVNCCSTADGVKPREVEWDMGKNHYRVNVGGKWLVVPNAAVIKGPNRLGHAVVWLYHEYEVENYAGVYVRCFIPGPAS